MKKKRNENVWRSGLFCIYLTVYSNMMDMVYLVHFYWNVVFTTTWKSFPTCPLRHKRTISSLSSWLWWTWVFVCFVFMGFLIRNNHISIVLFVVRFKERNNKKESLMGSSSSSRLRHFTACVPVAFLVKRWSMDHNQCFLSLPIHWFVIGVQSGLIVCFCLCVFFLVFSTPISLINPCLLQRIVNTSLFRSTWLDSWFIINSSG